MKRKERGVPGENGTFRRERIEISGDGLYNLREDGLEIEFVRSYQYSSGLLKLERVTLIGRETIEGNPAIFPATGTTFKGKLQ